MANYRDLLEQAGARYGVPEGLMTALGAKESSYNPAAVLTYASFSQEALKSTEEEYYDFLSIQ